MTHFSDRLIQMSLAWPRITMSTVELSCSQLLPCRTCHDEARNQSLPQIANTPEQTAQGKQPRAHTPGKHPGQTPRANHPGQTSPAQTSPAQTIPGHSVPGQRRPRVNQAPPPPGKPGSPAKPAPPPGKPAPPRANQASLGKPGRPGKPATQANQPASKPISPRQTSPLGKPRVTPSTPEQLPGNVLATPWQ